MNSLFQQLNIFRMATPEICTATRKNKNSPFCTGINKSLLTPCRRIGLSRKRKISATCPNTSCNSYYSENENSPLFVKNTCSELCATNDTPVIVPSKNSSGNISQTMYDVNKKKLFQSFTSEDLFKSDDNLPSSFEENIEESVRSVECEISTSCNKESFNNTNEKPEKLKNKKAVRRLSIDFSISLNKESENNTIKDCNDQSGKKNALDYQENNKSDVSYNTVLKNSDFIQNCRVRLHKLSEEEIRTTNIGIESVSSKANKKYKPDVDDEDFFTSTPEEEKKKRRHLENKMKLLEHQVKQKQLKLENLQRASIYKNKHNIEDLKKLTSVWKNGLVQGLNDLLSQLRAHGPIDMDTLLANLRIPPEIVSKLPLPIE